ncbi:MAG: hypothetical protein ABJB33_09975, partial [Gemmatimonadota bacterium]
MPSDPRIAQAVAALAGPIAEFRALVQGAIAQAESFLSEQAAGVPERTARGARELGPFAAGRVDPARFAALFPPVARVEKGALAAVGRAIT